MEISPNVDEMLLESMSGVKLDPLPEKPTIIEEVPRETKEPVRSSDEGKTRSHEEPVATDTKRTSSNEAGSNEYGDRTEEPSKAGREEAESNEYGLDREENRTYTKAEMDAYADQLSNQRVRERLARFERNQQPPTQQQQQQATQAGFQFDENSNLDWAQQLTQFFDQAADARDQRKAQQYQQAVEQERLQEFASKFQAGMQKFNDYHSVLAGKTITDAMVMAASDINDPAALFYAAAKREPAELARISKMENTYAQAAAIGRLDAKLRKESVKVSNAPKPLSQTKTDITAKTYNPKESSGNELDDLLIADKSNKLAQLNARRR